MAEFEVAAIMAALYGDGFIALPGAFPAEWADRMAQDIWKCFDEAKSVPGGAVARGPHRFYVEVQPDKMRGFVDIATHPWFVAVCRSVLGPQYQIVEVGFDIPFPGAQEQPWHRDFPSPQATLQGRRLNSLAFNLTAVDTLPDHGPLEIAPGTQWDDIGDARDGMFPEPAAWPRYTERAVQKLPRRGDMSARSALTIHRGTSNRSGDPRPVLVIGVDAPDADNSEHHDLQVTPAYLERLPAAVREHLKCRVVDRLEQVVQHHQIEGLL